MERSEWRDFLELKKDPGLPNIWPFKEEFLQKLERQKEEFLEEKERQKRMRAAEAAKKRGLAFLSEDAAKRGKVKFWKANICSNWLSKSTGLW